MYKYLFLTYSYVKNFPPSNNLIPSSSRQISSTHKKMAGTPIQRLIDEHFLSDVVWYVELNTYHFKTKM